MHNSHKEFLEFLRNTIITLKHEGYKVKLLEHCKDELECLHHNLKVQLDTVDVQYKILLKYYELLEEKGYTVKELREIAHNTKLEHMGIPKEEESED
jgi:hypothetical protein